MAGIGSAGATMVMAGRLYLLLAVISLLFALVWRGIAFPAGKPDAFAIHFYQHVIGALDGRACPSYPVCSLYAAQAVDRYGPLTGSWLMLDRLIHEPDDLVEGQWVIVDGEQRLYDPLARNAFWLH